VHDFNLHDAVFVIPRAIFRAPTTKQEFLEHAPLGPFFLNDVWSNGSHFFPYQIRFGCKDVTFCFMELFGVTVNYSGTAVLV
jgi:hypothetical protein